MRVNIIENYAVTSFLMMICNYFKEVKTYCVNHLQITELNQLLEIAKQQRHRQAKHKVVVS